MAKKNELKDDIGTLIKQMIKAAKTVAAAQITLEQVHGIEFVDGFRRGISGKGYRVEFQVFCGIDDIAEAMKTETKDEPRSIGCKPTRQIHVDHTKLYQRAEERDYYYKRAKKKVST